MNKKKKCIAWSTPPTSGLLFPASTPAAPAPRGPWERGRPIILRAGLLGGGAASRPWCYWAATEESEWSELSWTPPAGPRWSWCLVPHPGRSGKFAVRWWLRRCLGTQWGCGSTEPRQDEPPNSVCLVPSPSRKYLVSLPKSITCYLTAKGRRYSWAVTAIYLLFTD